jgi:hypothetical protein
MVAGIGLIILGLVGAVWALASSPSQVDQANQNTSVGLMSGVMQLLPGGAARIVFVVGGLAIAALGVYVVAT